MVKYSFIGLLLEKNRKLINYLMFSILIPDLFVKLLISSKEVEKTIE